MSLRPVCWLALALLVLVPWTASARRRSRFHGGDEGDPLCVRAQGLICQKFRIAVIGGGILSPETPGAGVGAKGSFFWVLGPGTEAGINALVMKDVRLVDGPYLGSVEGILRFSPMAGPYQRLFLEFSLGGSRYEAPDLAYWAFPSGGVAASVEFSNTSVGLFLTGGLSLLYAEGVTALPHAGVGLVF